MRQSEGGPEKLIVCVKHLGLGYLNYWIANSVLKNFYFDVAYIWKCAFPFYQELHYISIPLFYIVSKQIFYKNNVCVLCFLRFKLSGARIVSGDFLKLSLTVVIGIQKHWIMINKIYEIQLIT